MITPSVKFIFSTSISELYISISVDLMSISMHLMSISVHLHASDVLTPCKMCATPAPAKHAGICQKGP